MLSRDFVINRKLIADIITDIDQLWAAHNEAVSAIAAFMQGMIGELKEKAEKEK